MFEQYNSTSNSSDLVDAIVVDDSGIEIDFSSITFVGADGQASFYDGSISELGIGSGTLLTSGDGNPPTENTSGSFGLSQNGITSDPQLQAVADSAFTDSGEVQDINSLEFNFTITDPNVESVSFNLVFGSDEFPEFSDSSFVDVGAVFINDQNVGLFNNDPNQPLSIISENLELGNYQDNANNIIPIEYDGVSSVLSIVAPVQQGENTIRFAIADTGDTIYDSGLFISNFATSGVDTGDGGSGVLLNAPGTEEADEITGDETDQFIEGLGGNDTINPGGGNDIIDAGAGDDFIIGGIGNNGIDGGEGNDTVAYAGNQADLATTLADGSITVTGNSDSGEFTDTLNNIETIQYGDGSVSTDTLQPTLPEPEFGFADIVLNYFNSGEGTFTEAYGGEFPGGIGFPVLVNTDVVLGDDPGENVDFLSLPTGSFITVGFTDEVIVDGEGDDIFIQETGAQGETAEVFVSSDSENFVSIGIAEDDGTTSFDLADIGFTEPVEAIKIVGLDSLGGSPGFDVVNVQGLTGSVEAVNGGEDITGVDVYRFLRTDTQTQFYTTTDVERESVLANLPQYELEGISFVGVAAPEEGVDSFTGTSPVYRFFNTSTGIHLYTADENERAFVEENLDNYVAEGTPYYGYDTQVEGTVPLYRFYNSELDAHFYTPSIEERDAFIASPNYEPEGGGDGIAFYVEPAPEI